MGKRTLIALDTNHIKQYVFATDRLKEIRGASSILDRLNRYTMTAVLPEKVAECIYVNGGSGLFVVEGDQTAAKTLGRKLQQAYARETHGGASLSFAVQELPESELNEKTEKGYLELLNYHLLEATGRPHSQTLALTSHPFMLLCDSCGARYAEGRETADRNDQRNRYCAVCLEKRREDNNVKKGIERFQQESPRKGAASASYIWKTIIESLPAEYFAEARKQGKTIDRPADFNEFSGLSGGKDYLALIYADGNSIGQLMSELNLPLRTAAARSVDQGVYAALAEAIKTYLPAVEIEDENGATKWIFPFDILLIGGDDILLVTTAAAALDVALILASKFHEITAETFPNQPGGQSLALGIVFAPIKYPFGLLEKLADSTLKFAKQDAARAAKQTEYGKTRINFLVVSGATSHEFSKVYDGLHRKASTNVSAFYATLRPYTLEDLKLLLETIRAGKQQRLGRTKLHQMREAVLLLNRTTSLSEARAVLRNWPQRDRELVIQQVQELAKLYRPPAVAKDIPSFPEVVFPWFVDASGVYRTPLLDLVELYDFVPVLKGQEEEVSNAKA